MNFTASNTSKQMLLDVAIHLGGAQASLSHPKTQAYQSVYYDAA
jgi:hypothetical protein